MSLRRTFEEQVPSDTKATFTFMVLAGWQIDEARDKKKAQMLADMASMGEIKMPEFSEEARLRAEASAAADILSAFDEETLVQHGIVAWTGSVYSGVECNEANRHEINARTRTWAAQRIAEESVIHEGERNGSALGTGARDGAKSPAALTASAASLETPAE